MNVQLPQIGIGAFVDVETTGLNSERDEIVELSIALFAFERSTGKIVGVIDQYTGQRDPGIPIPEAASRVHGIRNEDVKGKELDRRKIESMMEQAQFIAAHNAGFDHRFVIKMFPAAKSKPWYCSMNGINWSKKGFESKGLQNLVKRYNIPIEQTHRAQDDVQLALLLLSQPSTQNDSTYNLLELISGKPMRRRITDHNTYRKNDAANDHAPQPETTLLEKQLQPKGIGCAAVLILVFFVMLAGFYLIVCNAG